MSVSKVVFITGASSGLGLSVASLFANKGYIVYGTSRNPEKYNPSKKIHLFPLDLESTNSIQQLVKTIYEKEKKIDILINNAGIGMTGSIEETSLSDNQKLFQINLLGQIEVIKSVLPYMRTQKSGLIINITSIAAYMGLPFRGMYSSVKSAFAKMSEALSMEVKSFGIKVINIAPGDFSSDISQRRLSVALSKESPYKENYKKLLDLIDQGVNDGADSKILAQKIYDISQKKNLKINYKLGTYLEKFSIVLKRILPDRVYEKILMKHYKI